MVILQISPKGEAQAIHRKVSTLFCFFCLYASLRQYIGRYLTKESWTSYANNFKVEICEKLNFLMICYREAQCWPQCRCENAFKFLWNLIILEKSMRVIVKMEICYCTVCPDFSHWYKIYILKPSKKLPSCSVYCFT